MPKAFKLSDDNYLDSTTVMHDRQLLKEILDDKMEFVSLLDKRIIPSALDVIKTGTLNDNYINYDLLFVRVTTSDGGGEGIWVTMIPKYIDQTNWYHYALSNYSCSGQIFVSNDNQIGIRVRTTVGWQVNRISIIQVFGLKFK